MILRLIRSPNASFIDMLLANVKPSDRKRLEEGPWGAVGLVQARLIDLYWAADVAEKSSCVTVGLVKGNCFQHTQMLAMVGHLAAVQAAMKKIQETALLLNEGAKGAVR